MEDKYYLIMSEYDLSGGESPNVLYAKASSEKKVHRFLENYCNDLGLDYQECLEEGLFNIEEIGLDEIILTL